MANEKTNQTGAGFLTAFQVVYGFLMAGGMALVAKGIFSEYSKIKFTYMLGADKWLQLGMFLSITVLVALSCMFLLMRYFFMPMKQLPALIQRSENKGEYAALFLYDIPVILAHPLLFYLIAKQVSPVILAYDYFWFTFYFALLIFVDGFWLITVEQRIDKKRGRFNVWTQNNFIHCLILLLCIFIIGQIDLRAYPSYVMAFILILTLSNSIFDFTAGGKGYFEE